HEPLRLVDLEKLVQCGISLELAADAGLVRVNSLTGAEMMARNGKRGDFAGIVFSYRLPWEPDKTVLHVLRRDNTGLEPDGEGCKENNKYRAGRKRTFDLVITDLSMPLMNGFDLISALRRLQKDLPILAISGVYGGDLLEAVKLLGAKAILEKPFEPEKLL